MRGTDRQAGDLAQALRLHQAGDVAGAEAIYARLLAIDPLDSDALHLLGVACYQRNDFAHSARLIAAAIRVRPDPGYFFNLGYALQKQGRPRTAAAAYRTALALRPGYAEAQNNLGNLLNSLGRLEDAVAAFDHALALEPAYAGIFFNRGSALHVLGRLEQAVEDYRKGLAHIPANADCHANLGIALRALGRADEAADAFRAALALRRDGAESFHNLGNALADLDRAGDAADAFRRSLALRPDHADAYLTLGNALQAQGDIDAALACFRLALRLNPDSPQPYNNMGNAFQHRGCPQASVAAYRQALSLHPGEPKVLTNLGNTLQCQGLTDRAIASYRRALRVAPDYAEAHLNLSFSLLLKGCFAEGWERYEWRWHRKGRIAPRRDFPQPLWRGERGDGRTLLLHCEQGLGDTIQFARYVPMALGRGWDVVFEAPPPLMGLFEGMIGVTLIEGGRPLPPFDVQCPLMSLPRAFGTTASAIPAPIPYIQVRPSQVRRWRDRLRSRALRVGLVWAGNPSHRNDHNRSIALERLAPWLQVPGVRFHALQKEVRDADRPILDSLGSRLTMLGPDLRDWTETAAALSALDLLIGVDTSVVHLAGALGLPVWVLLPFAPDWRWQQEREDCPWYPTMRLFRQPVPGDWDPVFARVTAELARLAGAFGRSSTGLEVRKSA